MAASSSLTRRHACFSAARLHRPATPAPTARCRRRHALRRPRARRTHWSLPGSTSTTPTCLQPTRTAICTFTFPNRTFSPPAARCPASAGRFSTSATVAGWVGWCARTRRSQRSSSQIPGSSRPRAVCSRERTSPVTATSTRGCSSSCSSTSTKASVPRMWSQRAPSRLTRTSWGIRANFWPEPTAASFWPTCRTEIHRSRALVDSSPCLCGRASLKVALVTGAAQGLGLATAALLARRGFHIIATDIQPLEGALAHIASQSVGIRGDISSEDFVRGLAARIASEHGALDVLVNNAGISCIAPAEDTTAEQWQRVMGVNLFGPFLLCKYLGAQMLERAVGSIVNVASVAGLAGISHLSAYNASKHGLIGLTRTLAAEWGGRGVRVNAVCPAWIKTGMDVADQGSGAYSDQDIIDRVPQARFARAADVAEAIAFLADTQRSGFVNGTSLTVDGGWLADASWESLRVRTRV